MTYVARIIVALDMLANVILGGDLGMTVSARADEARRNGMAWGCVLCRILAAIQRHHCANALSRGRHYAHIVLDELDATIADRYGVANVVRRKRSVLT